VMYITTSGVPDLGPAVGPGSKYREDPMCVKWEDLMCSFFEGGEWTLMSEIHSSDIEWNNSLGLPCVQLPATEDGAPPTPEGLRGVQAVPAELEPPAAEARASQMRRWCFSTLVKQDKLASYKKHHDEIWAEVAGGLRRAGIQQLTTWQLPSTNRLVMYITTSGVPDLGPAVGPGSKYREDPMCVKWEDLMDSFFEGGDWTLMSEIHSSDIEWNTSLAKHAE